MVFDPRGPRTQDSKKKKKDIDYAKQISFFLSEGDSLYLRTTTSASR